MNDILARILASKRRELDRLRARSEGEDWRAEGSSVPVPPDFADALAGPGISVIAEMKRASPSAGMLRPDFEPVAIAESYARHGAACISVLTDAEFFHGSIDHLAAVCQAVELPVLRKDFVLEPLQVHEARRAGASAVLLIAECLAPDRLAELVRLAHEVKLTALVEVYEPDNLDAALESGARLIGINNRNLRTFETDIGHTLALKGRIPDDRLVISESGIRTRADLDRLGEAGVAAVLVGETLMRAPDPGEKLRELLGR